MNQIDMFNGEEAYLRKMRENWKKNIEEKGGHCPCCERFGKVYKRKMNQHLALCLRWIYVHGEEDGWVDVQNKAPRWILKSKTYPLLEHWNLIESKENGSGVWKATDQGREFIHGYRAVPVAVHIYGNRLWGSEVEDIDFKNCFGKHFNFEEMMEAEFNWANIK